MKRLILILAVVAMLLPSCKKINEAIDGLDNRLDKLEQETIPSIDEQISAINTTLGNLDAMDKELKGYIDNLTTTASSLQEQINATNIKIDEVKAELKNDITSTEDELKEEIETAKANVIAQLEAAKEAMENELATINATIATLQAKDSELDGKITELRTYVDTELGDTTDWVNATFATLEQYNAIVSEVATIKEQIKAINQSITNLETRLTTKINEDIANAVSTLNADIQQKVSEITSAYTNAVKTAKEEITAAYTSAIQNAINALDVSLKAWVGEQLANYYTIAEVEAKITALNNSITNGDAYLQQELNTLKEQLTTTANEITAAYKKAIEEAITTNNGVIDTKIANEIASVNQRITNEVATINAKIAEIESRLDNVEAKIAELLARIQSVSYIPTYSDGKATVKYSGGASQVELDFKISPKECVAELEKIWKEVLKVEAVYTQTRAVSFIELQIVKCDVDTAMGVLSIVASCSNLSTEFFAGTQEASAALVISDGNNSVTSDYVPMTAKEVSDEELEDDILSSIPKNQIWYTTKDDSKLFPNTTDVTTFGAVLTSNVYKNGKGILTFDDNVTKIGDEAFKGCSSLTSITIPDSVTTIGSSAFRDCSGLTSVTIPDSVTSIEKNAFSGYTGELIVNCNIPSATDSSNGAFYEADFTKVTIGDGVTTIGSYAFYNCDLLTSVTIPDSVTSIGDYAFRGCDSLTSVTIPDSVTTIGSSAFSYCDSLTSVTIPDSVTTIGSYAFYNCDLLTSVTIPDSVTSIGEDAFWGCDSLTSVTIGNGVTSIGHSAFWGCDSLTSVTIPDSVTTIGSSAFSDCDSLTSVYITDIAAWCNISFGNYISNPLYYAGNLYLNNELVTDLIIPDSVTTIGSYTFYECSSLTSITIPDSVTTIGSYTFYECSSLTSITIPDSVTTIGSGAFDGCDSLTSVHITDIAAWCKISFSGIFSNPLYYAGNLYLNNELVTDLIIPDSVTTIGRYAFCDCDLLTSVTIPDSVTTIGNSAFSYCDSLTSVTIPDSVTSIGERAFWDCSSLKSVTIPDSVTSIGESAFSYCDSLTSVYITDIAAWCKISFGGTSSNPLYYAENLYLNNELVTDLIIPDSVTTIGNYAFRGCDLLTSVTIPDSVTSIGSGAFDGCDSLTSITIPDSVTSIGHSAFNSCSSLTSVYCKPTTPPTGGYNMFDNNASGRKIYVPSNSVEAYKSAEYWSNYSDKIFGYNF